MRKQYLLTLFVFSAIAVSSNVARATDVPIQGGPGGGAFRLACPGNMFMLGVALRSGAFVDAIRGNCLPFNGKDYVTPPTFTNFTGGTGGALQQNGCSADRYMVAIKIGFTRDDNRPKYLDYVEMTCRVLTGYGGDNKVCLDTGNGCWDRHPSPGPYNGYGLAFTLNCPANQAATGLFGRSGAYVDAVGLICGPKPVVNTSTSTTTTTPPPPSTLGAKIVAYAVEREKLHECVDASLTTRDKACPPLAWGNTGDGECTHLAAGALTSVKARFDSGNYDWGKEVGRRTPSNSATLKVGDIQPGDIIQTFNAKFVDPANSGNWTGTSSQHTAIVESNNGGVLSVLEQNTWQDCDANSCKTNRRFVTRGSVNLNWTLMTTDSTKAETRLIIYRAEPQPQGIAATRSLQPAQQPSFGWRRLAAVVSGGPQQRVKQCTCLAGFTHRLADAKDYVCAPTAVRGLIDAENKNAPNNRISASNNGCKSGFVWRELVRWRRRLRDPASARPRSPGKPSAHESTGPVCPAFLQPAEQVENALMILRLDAPAIVGDFKNRKAELGSPPDGDFAGIPGLRYFSALSIRLEKICSSARRSLMISGSGAMRISALASEA